MGFFELLTTAVCLSMDAFSVAVCKGLSLKKKSLKSAVIIGLYFGIFQAGMPLIGYFLASTFAAKIADYSFYIAFILLLLIGGNMIREALCDEDEQTDESLSFKSMVPLAVATSIDALANGVILASSKPVGGIFFAVSVIGITTFLISAFGVMLCRLVNAKFRKSATVVGGSVLIILGIKILLEGIL